LLHWNQISANGGRAAYRTDNYVFKITVNLSEIYFPNQLLCLPADLISFPVAKKPEITA
jgi:hypothetical protein